MLFLLSDKKKLLGIGIVFKYWAEGSKINKQIIKMINPMVFIIK